MVLDLLNAQNYSLIIGVIGVHYALNIQVHNTIPIIVCIKPT